MIIVIIYLAVRVVMKFGRHILRVIQRRIGVKQECALFPRFFSLYVNDIEEHLNKKKAPMVKLLPANMVLLLLADDIVLLSDSKDNFQKFLDLASENFKKGD